MSQNTQILMFPTYDKSTFASKLFADLSSPSKLNGRSYKGDAHTDGLWGEWAFDIWCSESWLPCAYHDTYEYDFEVRGNTELVLKVDVKTKLRNVPVGIHYDVHVEAAQKNYDADVYVFASHNQRDNTVQLCGWEWKARYWQSAPIFESGSTGTDGFTEKLEGGKLKIGALRDMNELANGLIERKESNA